VQFVVIGVIGTLVNLLMLTALVAAGVAPGSAVAFSILGAMAVNFVLSRRWDEAAGAQPFAGQLLSYVAATMPGALVNYAATLFTAARAPDWPLQGAALVGIAAGAGFNLAASRYLAFRARHVRAGKGPGAKD
jgi:putative flippase GtrA